MDRIDDAERDRVIEQLRSHFAVGRLDAETLNQRVETALATDDPATLGNLLSDLPASGYAWTPTQASHQQVVPYQAQPQPYQAAPNPAQQQNPWLRRIGSPQGLIFAIVTIFLITMMLGNGGYSTWWLFFFVFFWIPQMKGQSWRRRQPGPILPPQHFPPNQPQQGTIQDSFRPEEAPGQPPSQWPTRPQ